MDRFAPHPVFSVGRHRRPGRHREPADLERGADEQRTVHRDHQRPFLHRDVLRRVRRGDPIAEPDAHPPAHPATPPPPAPPPPPPASPPAPAYTPTPPDIPDSDHATSSAATLYSSG